MAATNLQEILDETDPVELLRNSQVGAYIYPVVAAEFTNWRREQRAWRETAVLFDQTHHMVNLFLRGPDALRLISDTAINSVERFPVDMAKQYVPTTPAGNVIGDGILFHLDEDEFVFVGRAPAATWLEFQAETGGYDVEVEKDDRSPMRPMGKPVTRKIWRFQVQGPNAWQVLEKVNGGPLEDVKFFRMSRMTIAGQQVRTLRHGMAGAPGLELWGPYESYDEVRETIIEGGGSSGSSRSGRGRTPRTRSSRAGSRRRSPRSTRARSCARTASGWRRRATRRSTRSRGASSRTTSRTTTSTRSSWATGRSCGSTTTSTDARRSRRSTPRRSGGRSTLAWSRDDVTEIFASAFAAEGEGYMPFDIPNANYGSSNFDAVLDQDDAVVGLSLFTGYSANEKRALSLATVDPEVEIGTELRVVWGEPDGGSRKTTVQRHRQKEVRVIVSPVPYSEVVRTSYAEGWRTEQTVS